jgi:hypothetical protein
MITKPLYFSVDDVKAMFEYYFATTPPGELTMSGLAMLFKTKQLMYDYEKRDGYKEIIQSARLRVENDYEKDLKKKGGSGNIFALKQFGWTDKTQQEISGPDGGPIETKAVLTSVEEVEAEMKKRGIPLPD